jgi:ferritin-like protein
MTTASLTRDQTLDELEFLASAEHALIVEYLTVGYALQAGHEKASRTAAAMAMSQMRRLSNVCSALSAAGRTPTLDRADSIGGVPFSPAGPTAYARLLDRETTLARAVDARYQALAGSSEKDLVDVIGDGTGHESALAALRDAVGDPAPDGLLATVRFDPATDAEADALAGADAAYRAVVTALRAKFADDEAFNAYLEIALAAMNAVDGVGRALARDGLVLSFNP